MEPLKGERSFIGSFVKIDEDAAAKSEMAEITGL